MVSIITAATVSTMQHAGPLSLVGMLLLLALLVQKELAAASRSEPLQRLGRLLDIAIAPLLLVFALLLLSMIIAVLQ